MCVISLCSPSASRSPLTGWPVTGKFCDTSRRFYGLFSFPSDFLCRVPLCFVWLVCRGYDGKACAVCLWRVAVCLLSLWFFCRPPQIFFLTLHLRPKASPVWVLASQKYGFSVFLRELFVCVRVSFLSCGLSSRWPSLLCVIVFLSFRRCKDTAVFFICQAFLQTLRQKANYLRFVKKNRHFSCK